MSAVSVELLAPAPTPSKNTSDVLSGTEALLEPFEAADQLVGPAAFQFEDEPPPTQYLTFPVEKIQPVFPPPSTFPFEVSEFHVPPVAVELEIESLLTLTVPDDFEMVHVPLPPVLCNVIK